MDRHYGHKHQSVTDCRVQERHTYVHRRMTAPMQQQSHGTHGSEKGHVSLRRKPHCHSEPVFDFAVDNSRSLFKDVALLPAVKEPKSVQHMHERPYRSGAGTHSGSDVHEPDAKPGLVGSSSGSGYSSDSRSFKRQFNRHGFISRPK
jgi:hypothetical protein